jgi:hypothetical protein
MDAPDEPTFLRDLVKASRQRPHLVNWVDRDGVARHTALTPAEAARVATIAARERVSKSEVLRRAAHIPVGKPAPRGGPAEAAGAAPPPTPRTV